jgi:hypothetical protein
MLQIRQGRPFVSLDPVRDGYVVRTATAIPSAHPLDEMRVLQALFPVPERLAMLANSVQEAYAQYRELSFLRVPFTRSLTLTLTLVLLLSLLMAVWGAFFFARKLTARSRRSWRARGRLRRAISTPACRCRRAMKWVSWSTASTT